MGVKCMNCRTSGSNMKKCKTCGKIFCNHKDCLIKAGGKPGHVNVCPF